MGTQICSVYRRYDIARRHRSVNVPAKQIADATENIPAVIERNRLQRLRQWYASLKIENRERVAANRDSKRIQNHWLLVLIDENALRNDEDRKSTRLNSSH